MRLAVTVVAGVLAAACGARAATPTLSASDSSAAFRAAGFKLKGGAWTRCEDDTSASHTPGALEVADLNGDGAPEAWITETSTYCYGGAEAAVVLLTKKGAGWVVLLDEVGVPTARKTRHAGWPDIEVGGPGMGPFPVFRFNGAKYVSGR